MGRTGGLPMNIVSWDEFRRQQQGEYQLTITPDELRLADFVSRVQGIEDSTTFPPHGMRIDSFKDKRWFKVHCLRVVVELERGSNRRPDDAEGVESTIGSLPPVPSDINALRKSEITARGM